MKLNKKKIIAREFLIFIACALIYGLTFLGTLVYNNVIESRIDDLETTSLQLSDRIRPQSKLLQLYNLYLNNNLISVKTSLENWFDANDDQKLKLFDRGVKKELLRNTTYTTFANTWAITPKEIEQYFITEKAIEVRENNEIKIRREKRKLMDLKDRLEFSLICLLIIGVLSFPLRYLFYGIKWSIKL